MQEAAIAGLDAGRHLRGDIYELRVDGDKQAYRLLFAAKDASSRSCRPWRHSRRRPRRPRRRKSTWLRDASPTGEPEGLAVDLVSIDRSSMRA